MQFQKSKGNHLWRYFIMDISSQLAWILSFSSDDVICVHVHTHIYIERDLYVFVCDICGAWSAI